MTRTGAPLALAHWQVHERISAYKILLLSTEECAILPYSRWRRGPPGGRRGKPCSLAAAAACADIWNRDRDLGSNLKLVPDDIIIIISEFLGSVLIW